jgi:hypothetical protein
MALQNNSAPAPSTPTTPNEAWQWQQVAFGNWLRNQHWRDKLNEEATRRALDLPAMSEGINANRTIDARNFAGLGWKEILALGTLAGGALWYSAQPPITPPTTIPNAPPPLSESVPLEDREYQIIHRDKDGNIINVLPWPPTGKPPDAPTTQ